MVKLGEVKMLATLVREYIHSDKLLAGTQGNMQVLPNGNVIIGWGSEPVFFEFSNDGDLLFDTSFPADDESYRAFRFPWSGHPGDDPAVAAEPGPNGKVKLHASWNGATEVATWQVLAGSGPNQLKPMGSAHRDGFETAITVQIAESYVAVQAKDSSSRVLGTAKAVKSGN